MCIYIFIISLIHICTFPSHLCKKEILIICILLTWWKHCVVCFLRYFIREEPQRSWGRVTEGNFSGMVGQLQREEADFCTMSSQTPERLQAIRHARAYMPDILTLVSLKPSFLPQHLAIIRPFTCTNTHHWTCFQVLIAFYNQKWYSSIFSC